MSIKVDQLEINVNLHSLQPGFRNYELHYIVASDEHTFRFVPWNQLPENQEKMFYCFRTDQKLYIPAGNLTINQSYVLKEEPLYPLITTYNDFIPIIESLGNGNVAKGIKRFPDDDLDSIKRTLAEKYGDIEMHVVSSNEAQHLLLVLDKAEISVSATMVYFRPKAPFSESHYHHVKE